jgi:hypothetical protein
MKDVVHEEWHHLLVPSNHGKDIYYRIFYGTVKWEHSADSLLPAYTIFIQYGGTEDWLEAKREIKFNRPPHILEEDLPHVLSGIKEISRLIKSRHK